MGSGSWWFIWDSKSSHTPGESSKIQEATNDSVTWVWPPSQYQWQIPHYFKKK